MGLTLTEAFGSDHSAAAQNSGGALKAIFIPADVYAAGALAVLAYVANQVKAAQDVEIGNDDTIQPVIQVSAATISTTQVRINYNFTITANVTDLITDAPANVVDPFN